MISAPQFSRLTEAPREFREMPFFTDSRPLAVLIKRKLVEIKDVVVERQGPINFVTRYWRITEEGERTVRKAGKLWNLGRLYENFVPYDVEEKEATDD
mgnify:FL=1